MKKVLIILGCLLALAAVGYYSWQQYQEAQNRLWQQQAELAKNTLAPIKQQFKSTLMQGMEQGVVEAIDYCKLEAPGITQQLPAGVEVGRTSHKLRNPKNRPSAILEAPLDYFLKLERQGKQASGQITRLPDDSWLYVEPIYTQGVCLACHGQKLSPEVQAALSAQYPGDQATGFQEGELRGLFWLKLKQEFADQ